MKSKNIVITRLINSIFSTLVLMYLFYKTQNGKMILIPFLVCSITMIGKNIVVIMNKNKYVNLFNNLFIGSFLLFWFVFLTLWCYLAFKQNRYQLIIFSIPFWLVGIYIIRKKILKKQKSKIKSKKSKFNPKILIGSFLVAITLVIGIIMLIIGIKDTYKLNKDTRDYVTVKGYYYNYDIYSSDSDGTTYQLIYIYEVDNKEYYITTNYGTSYIPDVNSIREVKYNPSNPEEAILVGTNNQNMLIYIGAFFTLGALTFILAELQVMGYFDKFKIDIMQIYIGIMLLIIGGGIIIFQNGTTMSLIETIKSFGLWIFIPFMFIIVGIYLIMNCLFKRKKDD